MPEKNLRQSGEYYFLNLDDWEEIVYFPLRGLAFRINREARRAVETFQKGGEPANAEEKKIIDFLRDIPELTEQEISIYHHDCDYRNSVATLCMTSDCNLRCVYCYAHGGRKDSKVLPLTTARTVISFIIDSALKQERDQVNLNFHGGGEPTYHWDHFRRIADYFQEEADRNNLTPNLGIQTNGFLSENQAEYLATHCRSINVSLDGAKRTQDLQRPAKGNRSSFDVIDPVLKYLREKNKRLSFRVTATAYCLDYFEENIRFLAEEYSPSNIHVEPMFHCTNGQSRLTSPPDPDVFSEKFLKMYYELKKKEQKLSYSNFTVKFKTHFCNAAKGNLFVTADNYLTSCLEILDPEDPRSSEFFFGYVNNEKERVVIDYEKLSRLNKMQLPNFEVCQSCFCKWQCGGDCIGKRAYFGDVFHYRDHIRCRITRNIMKQYLKDTLVDANQSVEDIC